MNYNYDESRKTHEFTFKIGNKKQYEGCLFVSQHGFHLEIEGYCVLDCSTLFYRGGYMELLPHADDYEYYVNINTRNDRDGVSSTMMGVMFKE